MLHTVDIHSNTVKISDGGCFLKSTRYIEQTDSRSAFYNRGNFTENRGGKQVGKEFYFITPSNIHTTGVSKPLFFGC